MGLKGLIEKELPRLFWMWCLAHRLELSIKDALIGTSFDVIDDMPLKLYYLYEKSPEKCRELAEISSDLKDCLTFDDGTRPLRASGSRWIAISQAQCNETDPFKVWCIHQSRSSDGKGGKRC